MTTTAGQARPSTDEERRRRRAAMLALFLPLLTGFGVTALFLALTVAPELTALGQTLPPEARRAAAAVTTAAQDAARAMTDGAADLASSGDAEDASSVLSTAPKKAATVESGTGERVRSAGAYSGAPRAARQRTATRRTTPAPSGAAEPEPAPEEPENPEGFESSEGGGWSEFGFGFGGM